MWSSGALWPGSRAWSCTPLGRTSFSFRNHTLLQNVYKFFLKDTHINSYIAIQRTGSLKHFYWETISVRQVLPIELGVAAEDRLGITGGLKAIPAAEQVLFQLLRVEIAKSGNSAHKYAPRQKMQGTLRCGEHPCFSLPQAGTGGAGRLREHLRSQFVRLILLKLFFCRGRL